MSKKEIRLVEWGLANNFGDWIEMHKDLPKFPELYEPILQHELGHDKFDKDHQVSDFVHDLKKTKGLSYWKLWKFMIKRPKTWLQFVPIYYQRGKGIVWDRNALIIYGYLLLLIVLNIILWPYTATLIGKLLSFF